MRFVLLDYVRKKAEEDWRIWLQIGSNHYHHGTLNSAIFVYKLVLSSCQL